MADQQQQVAKTILEQLGKGRFLAMTGARMLVGGDNFLQFNLPRNDYNTKGINKVRIELTPMDVYTVTFYRVYAGKFTEISKLEGVYFDMLQDVFTQETGLLTHM